MKALIAYFSRAGENYGVGVVEKGNTEIVAETVAELAGGGLFRIEAAEEYPSEYARCIEVAKAEQAAGARPALRTPAPDTVGYDTVFIGYPIWWGDMPMAVYTFLESCDLGGKTIAPFCTHEGSGPSGTARKIAAACPGERVLREFSLTGRTAQENPRKMKKAVEGWIAGLKAGRN